MAWSRGRTVAAGVALGTLALTAAVLWTGSRLGAPVPKQVGALPSHLAGESVRFRSLSGSTLAGWLLPGRKGAGGVVLMHHVRGSRLSMMRRAEFLSRTGYSVLLFDFQAHGESEGRNITFGYLESLDAQGAVRFLRRRLPGERLGIIGASLGGAAAVLAEPPLKADAVVLEAVYPTIEEAVHNRISMRLGPLADVLAPLLLLQLEPRLGIPPSRLRPIARIARLGAPVIIVAGGEDRHTSLAESRRLFESARPPKELWVIEGARHVDFHAFASREYERRVLQFFERYLRGPGEKPGG